MTSTNGANVERAMSLLQTAGYLPEQVATEVGVTLRTARRWAAGAQRPTRRNRTRLNNWVRGLRHRNAMRTFMDRQRDEVLEAAVDALLTDAERAERQATDANPGPNLGDLPYDQWLAAVSASVPAQRQPVRSITAQVDPFALVGEPEPALPF